MIVHCVPGTYTPLSTPKSTHPKVMGEMMNKIILQLKDSSLRVGTNKTLARLPKTC